MSLKTAPEPALGAVKQIDAGPLERRLRREGAGRRARGPPAARLAVRHPQLPRGGPPAGRRRPPGDRPAPPRVRHDPLPLRRRRFATASRRPSPPTRSPCWTRSASTRRSSPGSTGERGRADIVAALWPERCTGLVSVSGYLIGSQAAGTVPLPPEAELQWWYQYYFATERGRAGYDKYRREFAKLIWRTASPKWDFDDATFERSAASFDNPDHVAIVIHNYRWRLGLADGEPEYAEVEERLAASTRHHRAHDHARGRRERRAPPATGCLCREVRRAVLASHDRRAGSDTTSPRRLPRRSPMPFSTSAACDEPPFAPQAPNAPT